MEPVRSEIPPTPPCLQQHDERFPFPSVTSLFFLGSYFNFLLISPRLFLHSDSISLQFLTRDSLNRQPVYPFSCLPCGKHIRNPGDTAANESLFSMRLYLRGEGQTALNKSMICNIPSSSAKLGRPATGVWR